MMLIKEKEKESENDKLQRNAQQVSNSEKT